MTTNPGLRTPISTGPIETNFVDILGEQMQKLITWTNWWQELGRERSSTETQ